MKPVELVKIYKFLTMFKNGEEANAIQVARVERDDGEQLQYDIVVQKGLYEIGSPVIYIQPDYCIPQTNTFMEYHFPGGDKSKCRLGKKGRIRAIKFNFQFENDFNPIYSCGIIMPINEEIQELIDKGENLEDGLGVIKYVADDSLENGQNSGVSDEFPSHLMYKTDEPTIQNCKRNVDNCEGEELTFSIKKDGSSLTQYFVDEDEQGICSRGQKKVLDQTIVKGYNDGDVQLHKWFDKDTGALGWYNGMTKTFYTEDEVIENGFEPVEEVLKDSWVDTVMDNGYYQSFVQYCKDNGLKLALRGELIGRGNKGSGNKLNQDAKTDKSDVYWFGLDDLTSGHAKRLHYGDEYNLERISNDLGLDFAKPVLEGVFTYSEIIEECNKIFAKIKEETGQIIEGIVIRSKYSNKLSTKYINPEYDAKS